MPDALATVLRLRRVTVDDAKRQLAAALRHEEQASEEAALAEAAIGVEGQIAADLMAGDCVVEAYAAWLPSGQARARAARAACERAGSEVTRARASLSAARAAAEAANDLLCRRQTEITLEAARRAQGETDEIAGRIRAPANP